MVRYKEQNSTQTLREGRAEYRANNPELDVARERAGPAAEFFRCHDIAHVVFGCDTSLLGEALADGWTLFGTSVTLRQFLGFLGIEDHQAIIRKVGRWVAIKTFVRSVPRLLVVSYRSVRMKRRWPWSDFDPYWDLTLVEIRRQFGIRVLRS